MGENVTDRNGRGDQFEMLKALYDFKATFAKTLSFRENDIFILHQISTKQRNWWQVVNANGQVGYVPSNYVTAIQVSPEYWIQFLDRCLEVLREEGSRVGGCLAPDRQDLLMRLVDRRREAECCLGKRRAPLPPDFSSGASPHHSVINDGISQCTSSTTVRNDSNIKVINESPAKHSGNARHGKSTKQVIRITMSDTTHSHTNNVHDNSTVKSTPVPSSEGRETKTDPGSPVAYQLVEQVRKHTQLSHEMSRVAVAVVVESLCELLPSSVTPQLTAMLSHLQGPLAAPQPLIEETHDARRLKVIFTELTSCKEDSQQRSWMLYEDEITIIEYIQELISILRTCMSICISLGSRETAKRFLDAREEVQRGIWRHGLVNTIMTNADASISRHVMAGDKYHGVSTLVQYYQMEVRWSIRQLLLQAFGIMCSLDAVVVTLMLNSVLPMELARDMCSNADDISRLNYSALLLTMVFSMGEPMPVTHMEHLGVEFLKFLFDLIENPPETDVNEQIPDLFLNLVLSYNLQFSSFMDNVMLKALLERTVAKTFTEKILLLLNREEDPVRIFEHQPAPPHSVLKLFVDLFSNSQTATLFYTNDTKVLIDIIVRQLADLSPGDKRRAQYLELCRLVMRNTTYSDHHHRQDDILKCFTRIFCEESEQSKLDQQLVREISNEFPQYFKS